MPVTLQAQYVDISKFPDGPDKEHLIEIAGQVNALIDDVNQISGSTLDDKQDMWKLFAGLRLLSHYMGSGSVKVNVTLASVACMAIFYVLNKLGIDTQVLGPLVMKLIHFLMGQ